jgi:large subunit ribosomal protein L13
MCGSPGTDDCGDYVVVTNARAVAVTGRKADQKLYRHHSGFPGGLKEIPYKTMMEKKPEEARRSPALFPVFEASH